VIAGILPDIAGSMRISLALAGLAITTFALVYAFGAPILSAWAGAVERRRLLLISLLVLTAANLLATLAPSLPWLLAARVLAAVGAAMYTPTASAVAATLAPAQYRGRALAIVTTGLTASTVLGVPLGILIGTWISWQATLVFVALLSAIALLGVLLIFPRVAAPMAVPLRARLAFLKRPNLLMALVHTLLMLIGMQIVATYNRPLLQQFAHLDEVMVSGVLLLFGVAGLVGGVIGGYSVDRWGSMRTLVGGLIPLAAGLLLLPWTATTPLGAALTLMVWGLAGWALLPVQQHRLVSIAPDSANIVLSLNSSAIYLGISVGSALGSLLIQSTSLSVLCWVAGAWEAGVLVLVLVSARASRQVETKGEPNPESDWTVQLPAD
jgi:MFS transporter, DHA1 family, inner membrane transport protein